MKEQFIFSAVASEKRNIPGQMYEKANVISVLYAPIPNKRGVMPIKRNRLISYEFPAEASFKDMLTAIPVIYPPSDEIGDESINGEATLLYLN